MCLVAVALDLHPRYTLAIAANRDEFHARAAVPAHWWREGWLAGQDLEAGGTWFGVRRDGRFALVTNVREGGHRDAGKRSRGDIVTGALASDTVDRFVGGLGAGGSRYNGYNLLAGDARRVRWQSNRHPDSASLVRGVSTLSNASLGTPWPKTERIGAAMALWASRGATSFDALFDTLADRSIAPDGRLPSTGVTLERERALSAAFIVGERYGTRCSTVFAVTREGEARFVERSFDAGGRQTGEVEQRFDITTDLRSAQRARHRAVGNAGVVELLARDDETVRRVERDRVRLRVEPRDLVSSCPGQRDEVLEQRAADALSAPLAEHRHPADVAVGQEAPAADRPSAGVDGERVLALGIDTVPFEFGRHVLLDAEHRDAYMSQGLFIPCPVRRAHLEPRAHQRPSA